MSDKQGSGEANGSASRTALRALLEDAKKRSLKMAHSGSMIDHVSDNLNYGRNFENYARNFENYARNFENYARDFENGSSRNWDDDDSRLHRMLPNGNELPRNAAAVRVARKSK